jgi:hypothetical protein
MNRINKNFGLNRYSKELSVFQTVHTRSITICDVQDCIDSTRGKNIAIKRDYFESCCVDYDNVEKYYDVVNELNTMYYRDHARMRIISLIYHYFGTLFNKYIVIRDFIL